MFDPRPNNPEPQTTIEILGRKGNLMQVTDTHAVYGVNVGTVTTLLALKLPNATANYNELTWPASDQGTAGAIRWNADSADEIDILERAFAQIEKQVIDELESEVTGTSESELVREEKKALAISLRLSREEVTTLLAITTSGMQSLKGIGADESNLAAQLGVLHSEVMRNLGRAEATIEISADQRSPVEQATRLYLHHLPGAGKDSSTLEYFTEGARSILRKLNDPA